MNLYNELNAYSEEIDVFKIPLSSIDDNCLCATEKHELQLLKKVSLIYASFTGDGINPCYRISYEDKKIDSDFISKTEQFELREILKKDIPLSIRTRIEGVLNDLDFGIIHERAADAVGDHLNLLKKAICNGEWYLAKVLAIEAISMAKKTGKKKALLTNTVKELKEIIYSIQVNDGSIRFILALIKKLSTIGMVDNKECINILDSAISIGNKNIYDEVIFIVRKLKLNVEDYVRRMIKHYVEMADKIDNNMQAVAILRDALILARENGLDEKELKRKLCLRQSGIVNNMQSFDMKLNFDLKKSDIEEMLRGKNVKEALDTVINIIYAVAEQECEEPLVFGITGIEVIDDDGLTVDKTTGEEYFKYMTFENSAVLIGHCLDIFLEVLNGNYSYDENDLVHFFQDKEFIETERIGIFTCAYNLAFHKRYYESTYLLALQAEYVIRNIARLIGVDVINCDNNGINEFKLLSTLLEERIVIESIGANYLYAFKVLLCERYGANFRNLAAHGLLENKETLLMAYFCFLFLKFCTSYNIRKIADETS